MPKLAHQKEERLELRIREKDKEALEKAASLNGISVSSFVVMHALKAAKKEITSEQTISLSEKDAEIFLSALENPPKPTKFLRKSMKDFAKKHPTKD